MSILYRTISSTISDNVHKPITNYSILEALGRSFTFHTRSDGSKANHF